MSHTSWLTLDCYCSFFFFFFPLFGIWQPVLRLISATDCKKKQEQTETTEEALDYLQDSDSISVKENSDYC